MTTFEIMAVISCVTSTLTMFVVCVAILPHMKNGMAMVRDAILWAAVVVVMVAAVAIGFKNVSEQLLDRSGEPTPRRAVSQRRIEPERAVPREVRQRTESQSPGRAAQRPDLRTSGYERRLQQSTVDYKRRSYDRYR